jgi:uncharacterized protein
MTNEERDIITQFIARVGGAPSPSGFTATASVPATQAPALPPVDRDADSLIKQMFQQYPEGPYRMTQLAFVQEQGLIQAQNRIQQLEADLAQARQAVQQQARQPSGGGFFSGLFGGGSRQQTPPPPPSGPSPWGNQQAYAPPQQQYVPPPPPPQYAPGYQPGMFQRSGSGFLGSALTTAAGVAGGVVVGNMLTNMLTGSHHLGGGWGDQSAGGSPWGASGSGVDQGAWGSGSAPQSNQDYVDNGSWDQPPAQDASWSDKGGGSWDSGGGGSDSGSWDSGGGDSGGGSDDSF